MQDTDTKRKRYGRRCAGRAALRLLAVILAVISAAACQSEQEWPVGGGEDAGLQRLGISALYAYNAGNNPADATPETKAGTGVSVTRAASETPVPTDAAIGFFQQADGNRYQAKNNLRGAYNAAQGCWVPDDSLWLSGNPAYLAVYYPYSAAHTEPASLNLAAAWRSDATKDLWSARFEANNRTNALSLTLTQLYSRLTLAFVRDTTDRYTGVAAITQVKLESDSLYSSAVFNPLDSVYTYGASGGFTTALTGIRVNSATVETTLGKVDLLLPPSDTLTTDIAVTATIDGVDMKLSLPKAKFSDALLPGKQYTVTVKLRPMALEVAAVRTNGWDSQTSFTGDAGFLKKFPAVDIGLPFYIAEGNLVGTKQADGTITYAIAEEQGWYSGTADGGDYFCWNEPDPTQYNVTHLTWDDARDPCRQLPGGKWYTPTIAQTQAFADVKHIQGTWTKADGTIVNGMYFGTDKKPDPAEQNTFVFLPATGYRFYNGDMTSHGTNQGMVWCSEVGSSTTAYILGFSSNTVYSGTASLNRTNGLCLRCVQDK